MEYTQLDFAPYSPERKTLFQQAEWLLHELVKNRHHSFPCDCGACVYAAYQRSKKPKGRSFSKRTFFVYFLRIDFSIAAYFKNRLMQAKRENGIITFDYSLLEKYKNYAEIKIRDFLFKHDIEKPHTLNGFSYEDVYLDDLKSIVKVKTLSMLKKLKEEEKSPAAKKFLHGILNKKCFYEYFKRAGDPRLVSIVSIIRRDLLKP